MEFIKFVEIKRVKVLDKGEVALLNVMGDDRSVVDAARISYGKGTKKVSDDKGLIRYLLRHAHTTPFEMIQIQFYIKAPIFVFRQWHRSRTWSFNEISGRYSEMKDEFYIPDEDKITTQNPDNKQGGTNELAPNALQHKILMKVEAEQTFKNYSEKYLASGMRKELARINLPLSTYSEMYGSVNLHNLFHFLKLRLDKHAQWEIRVFAEAIYDLIKPVFPLCCEAFEDYKLHTKTLSRLDQNLLKDLLSHTLNCGIQTPEEMFKEHGKKYQMSKREWLEFFDWYDSLCGPVT